MLSLLRSGEHTPGSNNFHKCNTLSKAPDDRMGTVSDRPVYDATQSTRTTHRSKQAEHHNAEHGNNIQMQMDMVELMQQTCEAVSQDGLISIADAARRLRQHNTSFDRLQTYNDNAGRYHAKISTAEHHKPNAQQESVQIVEQKEVHELRTYLDMPAWQKRKVCLPRGSEPNSL